jgi:hypothetical protein
VRRRWTPLAKWLVAAVAAAAIGVPVTNILSEGGKPSPRPETPRPKVGSQVYIKTLIEHQSGDQWVVPGAQVGSEAPPRAPDCTNAQITQRVQWLRAHGGANEGGYWIRVEIVNDSPATLTIESLTLERFKRLPPVRGKRFVLCSEGAGDVGTQYIGLDLTHEPPTFRYFDDRYKPTTPFAFAPSKHEPAVFHVVSDASGSPLHHTKPRRYQWSMRLRYSLSGHTRSAIIDDYGRPFDVTG